MHHLRKLTIFLYPISLVLNDLKFIIFGLVFGFVIFTVPDQARDNFISMFGEVNYGASNLFGINFYHVFFWFFIGTWAFHAWGGSRVILYKRNYRQFYGMLLPEQLPGFDARIQWLQRYMPRFLAFWPFAIIGWAIQKVNGNGWIISWYYISAVLVFLLVTYRSTLLKRNPEKDKARFSLDVIDLGKKYVLAIRLFGLLFIVYFLLITLSIHFSPFIKSMLIVAISINMWTYIFTWLEFVTWQARVSLVLVIFITVSVFSTCNNNHTIRILWRNSPLASHTPVKSIEPDCREFLNTFHPDTIYLVAAQGGGIRAAFWTSYVLKYLSENNPGFMKKAYAFSGASGGSLGAAIFLAAWKRDQIDKNHHVLDSTLSIFYMHDFLSPLTAAFLGPDMLQKFWPRPIRYFDRARYLEKSWEEADASLYMARSFYDLFKNQNNINIHIPLLIFNSTWAETGLRTIIAPVRISNTPEFQNGNLSLLDTLHKDIRLSTTVLLSARFPFITPGGVVKDTGRKVIGTFVDGGYVDNSGIATMLDLKDLAKRLYNDTAVPCVIRMIYIENGDTSSGGRSKIGIMYETKTVISSFYNSWDGQDLALAHKIETYVVEFDSMNLNKQNPVTLLFTRITLPHTKDTILPLGWVLSEKAKNYMKGAVKNAVEEVW